jgi:hypothetical protein
MIARWTSASSQVRSLAKAVSAAFAASALTDEEKSPGKIEITDLPWQAPPLITPHMLSGGALQDYFDAPLPLDQALLHAFWTTTLAEMWYRPSTLLKRGILAGTGRAMPAVRHGQRAFRFARPAGWPTCEDLAGVSFSLEVAHAARVSLPIKDFVSDDDNYFAVFADGAVIGVKDGLPACVSPWTMDASGIVQELLLMPRGEVSYACEYDQLAAVRSVLHVHQARFPHNFQALDQALQALRLLSLGGYCPELLHALRLSALDIRTAKERERALFSALDVIDAEISDRSKLVTLRDLLVPDVLSVTTFKRHIFASDTYPFTLARGKLGTIRDWVVEQYQQLPVELQKGQYAVSKA